MAQTTDTAGYEGAHIHIDRLNETQICLDPGCIALQEKDIRAIGRRAAGAVVSLTLDLPFVLWNNLEEEWARRRAAHKQGMVNEDGDPVPEYGYLPEFVIDLLSDVLGVYEAEALHHNPRTSPAALWRAQVLEDPARWPRGDAQEEEGPKLARAYGETALFLAGKAPPMSRRVRADYTWTSDTGRMEEILRDQIDQDQDAMYQLDELAGYRHAQEGCPECLAGAGYCAILSVDWH